MTIDTNDIRYINADKVQPFYDNFVICNYLDPECKGCIRAISFEQLCKAVARRLVKDGVIPGGDE